MTFESMVVGMALLLSYIIVYTLIMVVKSICMYITESRLDMGNKGLVFLPIYWNWVEGQIFERLLNTKLTVYKIFVTVSPIIMILGQILYVRVDETGANNNLLQILWLVVTVQFIIMLLMQIIMRIRTLNVTGGSIVLSIVFGLVFTDFWCIYQNRILKDNRTNYETTMLKRHKELEKMGMSADWHEINLANKGKGTKK